MKQLLFFFMLISISINSLSQQCTNGTNAQEFNRKRHWVGGSWGHPYTMFDRHNGISFDSTVKLIRKRILEEKPVGISLYGGPV
ncbi:MAG: hypothetical protein Q8R57_15495, partial [Bacteroidota bacterium]|nr:hypothetical protein [Bacteroidota bacterium]